MVITAERIIHEALHLSAAKRAQIAEKLLSSLDKPDPTVDQLWTKEVEARIDAAERGEMGLVSEEDVFAKYEKR